MLTGSIWGTYGIHVTGAGSKITTLTNNGVILGASGAAVAIAMTDGGVIGSANAGETLINRGLIGASMGSDGTWEPQSTIGILVSGTGSNLAGGLSNTAGALIDGKISAIKIADGGAAGKISNSGWIIGENVNSSGIRVENAGVGDIENAGTISALGWGIYISNSAAGTITNSGLIMGGDAIYLTNLTNAVTINLNEGARVVGDIFHSGFGAPGTINSSLVNIRGDFATEGNIQVTGLNVSADKTFTISPGNTVTLYDMSGIGTGTWAFGVESATNHGKLVVTNGAVDFSGVTIEIDLSEINTLADGDEFMIADGMDGTVAVGDQDFSQKQAVEDASALFDFEVGRGGLATDASLGADDSDLVAFAIQVSTAQQSATSDNNAAVGAVLDDLRKSGTTDPQLTEVITNIGKGDTQEVNEILDSVLPSVNGDALAASRSVSDGSLKVIRGQVRVSRGGGAAEGVSSGDAREGLRMWSQAFGAVAEQDERKGMAGYDVETVGLAVGVDTETVFDDAIVGVAFSYGKTGVDSDDANRTSTDVDSYQVTLYGDYRVDGRTHVTGMLGYVYGENDSMRTNVGGVPGLTGKADFDSHQFVVQAEVGRDYALGQALLTPSLLLHYVHYDAESYTEEDAGGASLAVDGTSVGIFELGVGVNARWRIEPARGGVLEPALRAGYRYDLIGDEIETTARFTGGGAAFETRGVAPARGTFNVGAGVTYRTVSDWTVSAGYDYEFKEDFESHAGFVRALYEF